MSALWKRFAVAASVAVAGCAAPRLDVSTAVVPMPDALAAETLFVSIASFAEEAAYAALLKPGFAEVLSGSFPRTTIQWVPKFDEYSASPKYLSALITVLSDSLSFTVNTYTANVTLSLLLIDRRPQRLLSITQTVAHASDSRLNWGRASGKASTSAALSDALKQIVRDIALAARGGHASTAPLLLSSAPEDYVTPGALGVGSIAGQAFLTTRGGDVKVGAGRIVTLDPLTPFSRSWYERVGRRVIGFEVSPPDQLFATHRRVTISDGEGRFQFKNVPAGRYLLRSVVTWETGGQSGQQGGVIATLVSVSANDSLTVVVSNTEFKIPQ